MLGYRRVCHVGEAIDNALEYRLTGSHSRLNTIVNCGACRSYGWL